MKKTGFFLLCLILILTGCDGVYDTSVQGVVLDWDDYNDSSVTDAGVNDVDVYLYLEETVLDEDLTAWNSDGTWPDDRVNKKGVNEAGYYAKTTTAASGDKNGVFGFNGVMWHNLFPEFGKPGDRVTLYFLFYHKDYGMVKADNPVTVTSGVTNNLPQFRIKKALCEVSVSGYVTDMNKKQEGSQSNRLPLSNVTVSIYMPLAFDSTTGAVNDNDWNITPKYTVQTDADGRFEQKINFTKRAGDDVQKCTVMLVFDKTDYVAYALTSEAANQFSGLDSSVSSAADVEKNSENWVLLNGPKTQLTYKGYDGTGTAVTDITETVGVDGTEQTVTFDINGDGKDEVCLPVVLSFNPKLSKNIYTLSENIYLRQYNFSTTVRGKIIDSTGKTYSGSVHYANNQEFTNAKSTMTTSSGSGDTIVYEYQFTYSWTLYNYTTDYSYQLIYMKAKVPGTEIKQGTNGEVLINGSSENAVDFDKT